MKSGIDVRYGLSDVVSHDGTRMPCLAVNTLADFRATMGDEEYEEVSRNGCVTPVGTNTKVLNFLRL